MVTTVSAGCAEPQPGRASSRFDERYELGPVLGRGGMSTVYRAHDRCTGRDVAVKLFRPAAAVTHAGCDTRHEADVLAQMDNPGLAALIDAPGRADASPDYLVTELVAGPTLAQRVGVSTLTESQVARLGAALCRTLAYVHAQGVVHCDVKPANILLCSWSDADLAAPKLVDFGIATAVDSRPGASTGVTVGTPNYLSPEQVRGRRITPATDIYSLGLVLIEAMTGTLAYPGHGVDAATTRLTRSPMLPDDAGDGLRAVLEAMTARDPDDRPDANRAAELLGEVADGSLTDLVLALDQPVTGPAEPDVRTSRRRLLALGAGCVVAGCATLIATLVAAGSTPRGAKHANRPAAAPAPVAAPQASVGAPPAPPTGPPPRPGVSPVAAPERPAAGRTPPPALPVAMAPPRPEERAVERAPEHQRSRHSRPPAAHRNDRDARHDRGEHRKGAHHRSGRDAHRPGG